MMEEWIGRFWDGFIGACSRRDHPDAAVSLASMERMLAVYFRSLGGDPALRVAGAVRQRTGARQRLIERVAGAGTHAELPSIADCTLRLPATLAVFAQRALNRQLYLWLAALAAAWRMQPAAGVGARAAVEPMLADEDDWLRRNQRATLQVLARWPGLRAIHSQLVEATIALRRAPESLPDEEAAREHALRQALRRPGSVDALPSVHKATGSAPECVPLWLYAPPQSDAPRAGREADAACAARQGPQDDARPAAQQSGRADVANARSPFVLPFRAESLLSWAEFLSVNRPTEEDTDPDSQRLADSIDRLALAQSDMPSRAARVRFDLDLPAVTVDDLPLGPGHLLPEWDYRQRRLLPDYCRLQPLTARDATTAALPEALRPAARRLRNQLAALAPSQSWRRGEWEGCEPDIDACVRAAADLVRGGAAATRGLYRARRRQERDLACLLLADLSQSTDAWVSDSQRVIDVIQQSLMLFAEALAASGDACALYGFSSLKRSLVRFHDLKHFDEPMSPAVRGRIGALKPGYYTRLGVALREGARRLAQRSAAQRLLLILTDGKPHDIDHYEGRYGIEDTRAAVLEARRAGVRPFCVTIDREGAGYLPHVFGRNGYVVIRRPQELPSRLPLLYAQLSGL